MYTGNREKLLHGAMECLRTKGYARTTARDLVAASGANLASIGYHYGSKEALLNEAVAHGMTVWIEQIEREAFTPDAGSTAERLRRSLAAMVDRFDELEPYLVAFVEAFPAAVRSDDLRERMAAGYERARAASAASMRRAWELDGATISDEDADTLASLAMAVCDGLILQWMLEPGRTPDSARIVAALSALRDAPGVRAAGGGARRSSGSRSR